MKKTAKKETQSMDYQDKKAAWLASDLVSEKDKTYIRAASDEQLREMFGANLAFGTGGMRALLGPGNGRMNLLTVRRATIGISDFLLKRYGPHAALERGVAISFDNRHYSTDFQAVAAKVLTERGFTVYTFKEPHPTPELSYSVRMNNCVGGIMITASHNPKEYNGYKFYDEKGCQGVYAIVDEAIKAIDALPDELTVSYVKVPEDQRGKIIYLDDDESYDLNYVTREVGTSLYAQKFQGPRLTTIVFSPECGCNCKVGPMALRKAGYTVIPVPGQDWFDPDFTATENPNPETEGAFKGAFAVMSSVRKSGTNANLILLTDPDADRCGVAFLDKNGVIQRLTGNETGALLIDFVLGTHLRNGDLPSNGIVLNTFVTGGQGAKVADLYGVPIRTTATGFKYIGNLIDRLPAVGQEFLFGYEESYGYLLGDFVRDKDSLQSIVAVADMNEFYLRQGKTLDVAYEELCQKTGRYDTTSVSVAFPGADSLARMAAAVEELRKNPPSTLGGVSFQNVTDYQKRTITDFTTGIQNTFTDPDIDVCDCLRFNVADGSFLAVRPSGTEPKIKFYVEIVGKSAAEGDALIAGIVADLKKFLGL
jgi:phosphoglucomutase